MPTQIELPGGELAPLAPLLAGASYVNLVPGVGADDPRPAGPLSNLFGSRGPEVPLATWTPGEIGLQHGAGPGLVARMALVGHPVPQAWYVVQDHPKRGLVLRTYDTDALEVLGWLREVAELVCPLEITGPWRATVG